MSRLMTGVVFCVVSCIVAAAQTVMHAPTGRLEVWFMDIGQGDATLLQSPSGRRVLIDGGPDRAVLAQLGRHMPLLDRTLDLVVLTHPDSDHSKGMIDVLRRYRVRAILLPPVEPTTDVYHTLLAEVAARKIPVLFPDTSLDLRFSDGLTLDVLWPGPAASLDDPNNASIVLRASAGGRSVLLTGDIEGPGETGLLQTGGDIRADVLKVAHHGSKTSTATGFLLAASPRKAVISAAKRNMFGHPNAGVVDRLKNQGVFVTVTGWEGEGEY